MLYGDVDTNCAIGGGMVGAYVGVGQIPGRKLKVMLGCRVGQDSGERIRRPRFVQPGFGCVDEMLELVGIAPQGVVKVQEYVDMGLEIDDLPEEEDEDEDESDG